MTYEETVARVREIVSDPSSMVRSWSPGAGEPEVGRVRVHWKSSYLAELQGLEGVRVETMGRCGREKDGHICEAEEGEFHMTHVATDANGNQYTWEGEPPPAFVPPTDGSIARAPGLGPKEEEPVTARAPETTEVDARVLEDQGKEQREE